MTRRAFYSFHYANDAWRAATVRNIGTFEESEPVSDNEWETIKKGGKAAIESWIQSQMEGRGVVVVLIGSETYKRPWVLYEIQQGYELNKVMVGIYIHNLKNAAGDVSAKGQNPFAFVKDSKGVALSSKFHAFDPPGSNSKDVYAAISDQLKKWFP